MTSDEALVEFRRMWAARAGALAVYVLLKAGEPDDDACRKIAAELVAAPEGQRLPAALRAAYRAEHLDELAEAAVKDGLAVTGYWLAKQAAGENLHEKWEIAAELSVRDKTIADLLAACQAALAQLGDECAEYDSDKWLRDKLRSAIARAEEKAAPRG
jgi:hypothetical protein